MKKYSNFYTIVILYLLTVPTNVMCLGVFTDQWLFDFSIARQDLTNIYGFVTIFVFTFLVIFKMQWNIYRAFIWLSATCFSLILFKNILPFKLLVALVFFVFQCVGQGLVVAFCRMLILKQSDENYGFHVGVMESLGTMMVFVCPFIELKLIYLFSWEQVILFLGIVYGVVAWMVKRNKDLMENQSTDAFKCLYEFRFLLTSAIVYLPVVITSGLFFHLEFFCCRWGIDWIRLSQYAIPQAIGIVIFQFLFGFFWKPKRYVWILYVIMLVLSQVLFIIGVMNFSKYDGYIYLVGTVIGWSLFGILVNAIWSVLYVKNENENEIFRHLKASVSVGFLANALGPWVFYLFI